MEVTAVAMMAKGDGVVPSHVFYFSLKFQLFKTRG